MQLQTENKYLHVPSRLDIKVEVDRLFVTLTLEHQGTELREYSHKDLLKAGNRLRIIGDPGSGKFSLVKRVFRDTCRAGIAKPSKTALPILFELKNLRIPTGLKDKGLGDWFYGVLREATQATAVYKMESASIVTPRIRACWFSWTGWTRCPATITPESSWRSTLSAKS